MHPYPVTGKYQPQTLFQPLQHGFSSSPVSLPHPGRALQFVSPAHWSTRGTLWSCYLKFLNIVLHTYMCLCAYVGGLGGGRRLQGSAITGRWSFPFKMETPQNVTVFYQKKTEGLEGGGRRREKFDTAARSGAVSAGHSPQPLPPAAARRRPHMAGSLPCYAAPFPAFISALTATNYTMLQLKRGPRPFICAPRALASPWQPAAT